MVKKGKKPSFEEQMTELEDIVRQLDSEDLPLEQAIDFYEQGVKLSMTLNQTLEEAQRKVEILTQKAGGDLEPEPFDEGEA